MDRLLHGCKEFVATYIDDLSLAVGGRNTLSICRQFLPENRARDLLSSSNRVSLRTLAVFGVIKPGVIWGD